MKGKQRDKCRKTTVGLKIKIKIIKKIKNKKKWKKKEKKGKKRKENSTELQMPKVEAEVYSNNKKCD